MNANGILGPEMKGCKNRCSAHCLKSCLVDAHIAAINLTLSFGACQGDTLRLIKVKETCALPTELHRE